MANIAKVDRRFVEFVKHDDDSLHITGVVSGFERIWDVRDGVLKPVALAEIDTVELTDEQVGTLRCLLVAFDHNFSKEQEMIRALIAEDLVAWRRERTPKQTARDKAVRSRREKREDKREKTAMKAAFERARRSA